jgi:hypothetical protein
VRLAILPLPLVLAAACGSPKPAEAPAAPSEEAPAAPAAKEASEPEAPKEEAASKIPTACAEGGDDICKMPKSFVERLCQNTYPNVALVLFSKEMPWTHGYLTRKTQAWNAEGGASVQGWLEFDEEVLLLSSKAPPKGGMQVSGMGGYQALRWDGSCVTLASEEVTTRKPPAPKHPRIEWRWIEDGMRDALRKDPKLDEAAVALKRECKGVSVGDVSKKCVDADQKLGDLIVKVVEGTGGLPEPKKLP